MLKTLDRYLLKYFLQSFLVVTLAIGMTILIINVVSELRNFVDHQMPAGQIVVYYVYFAGWILKSFLPMFVMLAILFSVSILARRREILALKACGISLYRVALPIFLASAFLALAHFYYSEYFFPPYNQIRLEMKEYDIDAKSKAALARVRNVYRQVSRGKFYTISSFDSQRGFGRDFKLYETNRNKLSRIVTANTVSYEDHRWLARDGQVRSFDSIQQESFAQFDTLTLQAIKDKPSDFERPIGNPEDMGLEELRHYIDLQKRTGGPYTQQAIDLQLKYSFPLASIVVVLICVPFAANPQRSGIARSFALGAGMALLYFILFRVLQSAGYNEKVPEWLAVWGVNGLFFITGIVLMIGARK